MLKDIKVLQENLKKVIEINLDDRILFEEILEKTKGKFREGVIADLFNQTISFYTLNEEKCYFLAQALKESLSEIQLKKVENEGIIIDVEDFFTDKEIKEIKIDMLDVSKVKNKNSIELKDMEKMESNLWSGSMTLQEWADLMNENYFLYKAGELQREGVKKEEGGRLITSPYVNYTNVKKIMKKLLSKKYVAHTITIACIKTDSQEEFSYIKYNEENIRNTKEEIESGNCKYNDILIEISSKCPIYLLDGMHNSIAIQRTASEARKQCNFDVLNKKIKIDFAYWDVNRAQDFIHQMQQGAKMGDKYVKTLDMDNNAMSLTRELNRNGNEKTNEMYNRLVTNNIELKYNGYCLMNTFADSINIAFKELIEKPRHYSKTKEYMEVFYNELLGIFKEQYDVDDLKELQDLVIIKNNMFIFYNGIAKELYKNDVPKNDIGDFLKLMIKKIDWSINNNIWDDNGIFLEVITKTSMNKILQLSESIIKEVI